MFNSEFWRSSLAQVEARLALYHTRSKIVLQLFKRFKSSRIINLNIMKSNSEYKESGSSDYLKVAKYSRCVQNKWMQKKKLRYIPIKEVRQTSLFLTVPGERFYVLVGHWLCPANPRRVGWTQKWKYALACLLTVWSSRSRTSTHLTKRRENCCSMSPISFLTMTSLLLSYYYISIHYFYLFSPAFSLLF